MALRKGWTRVAVGFHWYAPHVHHAGTFMMPFRSERMHSRRNPKKPQGIPWELRERLSREFLDTLMEPAHEWGGMSGVGIHCSSADDDARKSIL